MTNAARLVLADCEEALAELMESNVGSMWRRRWVGILALLRAVGHVLKTVDGKLSASHHRTIEENYKILLASKPEPKIYWKFIFDERNFVLKEYSFRAYAAVYVSTNTGSGMKVATPSPITGKMITAFTSNQNWLQISIMQEGPFKGYRDIDVVREAIKWWYSYLDSIDSEVVEKLGGKRCLAK